MQPHNKKRIGLVTDVGRVDDGTFNQYAYEGLMRAAEELGLEVEVVETASSDEYDANLQKILERDCPIVVTVGSSTGPRVERILENPEDVGSAGPLPDHASAPPTTLVDGHLHGLGVNPQEHLPSTLQLVELGEDQTDRVLDALVGILDHPSLAIGQGQRDVG